MIVLTSRPVSNFLPSFRTHITHPTCSLSKFDGLPAVGFLRDILPSTTCRISSGTTGAETSVPPPPPPHPEPAPESTPAAPTSCPPQPSGFAPTEGGGSLEVAGGGDTPSVPASLSSGVDVFVVGLDVAGDDSNLVAASASTRSVSPPPAAAALAVASATPAAGAAGVVVAVAGQAEVETTPLDSSAADAVDSVFATPGPTGVDAPVATAGAPSSFVVGGGPAVARASPAAVGAGAAAATRTRDSFSLGAVDGILWIVARPFDALTGAARKASTLSRSLGFRQSSTCRRSYTTTVREPRGAFNSTMDYD